MPGSVSIVQVEHCAFADVDEQANVSAASGKGKKSVLAIVDMESGTYF